MNDRKRAAVAAKSCAFHRFGVRNSGRKLMEMEWNGCVGGFAIQWNPIAFMGSSWRSWDLYGSSHKSSPFLNQGGIHQVEQPWRSGVESPISEVNYSELTRPKRLVWKESSPKWLDISMIGIWRLVKYEITHQRGVSAYYDTIPRSIKKPFSCESNQYGNHSNSQIELVQAWLENFNFSSRKMCQKANIKASATWLKAKHQKTKSRVCQARTGLIQRWKKRSRWPGGRSWRITYFTTLWKNGL